MKELIEKFARNEEEHEYIEFHYDRFQKFLKSVKELIIEDTKKVCVFAPSIELHLLRVNYPNILFDSLGFMDDRFKPRHGEKHIHYDLNYLKIDYLRTLDKYDLIIYLETIEHLFLNPKNSLQTANSLLKSGGKMILQTPNAVSVFKRIQILKGKNPYEKLRDNLQNPGHFREYTKDEISEMLISSEFEILDISMHDFERNESLKTKVLKNTLNRINSNLRETIEIICIKL